MNTPIKFFEAWGSITSLKSQTWDPRHKVPPGGLVLRILTSWKNPSTSVWTCKYITYKFYSMQPLSLSHDYFIQVVWHMKWSYWGDLKQIFYWTPKIIIAYIYPWQEQEWNWFIMINQSADHKAGPGETCNNLICRWDFLILSTVNTKYGGEGTMIWNWYNLLMTYCMDIIVKYY